jgi:diguanylate cyclase (GGDEF)-like protein
MKSGGTSVFVQKVRARFLEDESGRFPILLGIQIALIVLLAATAVTVILVDIGERRVLYLALVISLLGLMIASLLFNLSGKYKASAWLTVIGMQIAPWGSILLDSAVRKGDFVPLVYIALSIQLCAILLPERAILSIAVFQLCSITAFVLSSPGLMAFNWASLVIFVFFTATLGIVTSYVTRNHIEQIERHKKELENDRAKLRDLSVRDSLTGLFNRRYMEETLEREVNRAVRKNRDLGIIMADIDGFKKINDTFGHAMGDSVLSGVAGILGSSIRSSDAACRYGGDEFTLILPECSLLQTRDRAETLRETIKNTVFHYGGKDIGNVNLSFGIAMVPVNGSHAEELLKFADDALYAVKNGNRTSADPAK